MPHTICQVEPGSIADQLGLRAGDQLRLINGRRPHDLIDYQAFCCEEDIVLSVERAGRVTEYSFEKDEYEPLGLMFGETLMSRQCDCVNKCVFCFVDQLPDHVRKTLRVKDDDWRMSLMMGNFVTLTNVSDRELDRIIARRAAPLYISVHATDPDVRADMLGQALGKKIMQQLGKLYLAGMAFHTQAVVCPGYNDLAVLDKTITELAQWHPHCMSLALVPVGLTGHREGLTKLTPFNRESAQRLIDQVSAYQQRFVERWKDPFVHIADEFYLMAGRDFPPDEFYGDYPQIENGVGLCRYLETEYRMAWEEADFSSVKPCNIHIACGVSVALFLKKMLGDHPVPNVRVTVHALTNTFFGDSVTVSGLLTGGALKEQLRGITGDRLLISENMLRDGEDVFLDDCTLEEVQRALQIKIDKISGGEALLWALSSRTGG